MNTRQYNKRIKATKTAISKAQQQLSEYTDINEGDIISGFRVLSITQHSGNCGTWCRCELSRHGETLQGESSCIIAPDDDEIQYIRVGAVLSALAYHAMQLMLEY